MTFNKVLIVGMARSGTTLVSHILGSLPNAYPEIEPHALWKSGNFHHHNDQIFDLSPEIINNIRAKFLKDLPKGMVMVEKSPINCIRPELVHAVFPDAKIIYIERDPVRCVYSNYSRSLKKDSFKLSIILKKYFLYTGSKDLDGAISKRGLFKQISFSDLPSFIYYISRMFYLRNFKNSLPFGTKLKDFEKIVSKKGLLAYHVDMFKYAIECKSKFLSLYGDNIKVFKMEEIMEKDGAVEELVSFSGLIYDNSWLENIKKTFDKERVVKATKKNSIDSEILQLLRN